MRAAAKGIGRNVSTVSRELARNTGLRGYRYKKTDAKSRKRHSSKGKNRISAETWFAVEYRLHLETALNKSQEHLPCKG